MGNCPRCPSHIHTFDYHDTLDKCPKRSTIAADNSPELDKFWLAVKTSGSKSDDPGSLNDSRAILQALTNSKVERGDLTKWKAENAYRKVHGEGSDGGKGKPALKSGSATGPASSSARPRPGEGGSAATKYSQSAGKSTPATKKEPKVPATGKLRRTPAPNLPSIEEEPEYSLAVLQCALDKSLNPSPKKLNVAVNYVVVKDHPAKLYVYGIDYGNIHPMKTSKQIKEDEQAAALVSQTETLSLGAKSVQTGEVSKPTDGERDEDDGDGGESDGAGDSESRAKGEGRKVSQRGEKMRIFGALQTRAPLSGIKCATDGATLWSLEPLNMLTMTDVEYKKLSGRKYKLDCITFNFLQDLDIPTDPARATKALVSKDAVTEKGDSMRITALNALISQHVIHNTSDRIVPVGPNKFFLKGGRTYDPNDMLDIHRGYFTSIRPGSSRILLNVNVATSAFYRPVLVSELYRLVKTTFNAYGKPEGLLKGLSVRIAHERVKYDDEYDPNNEGNRHRTIAGFGDKPAEEIFELDGKTISVARYFEQMLGANKLAHPDLPCVSVTVAPKTAKHSKGGGKGKGKANFSEEQDAKTPQPLWIPAEYLQIDPYQPFKKVLSGAHTDAMINVAARHPAKNQNLIIQEAFPLLGIDTTPSPFEKVGLTLGSQFLQIPATNLVPPKVFYRNRRHDGCFSANVTQASWNLIDARFYITPSASDFRDYPLRKPVGTLDMRSKSRQQKFDDIGKALSKQMVTYGIKFDPGVVDQSIYLDAMAGLLEETAGWNDITLYELLRKELLPKLGNAKLVVVLLSTKDQYLYGCIKRVCDQWLGVHTLCIVEEKLRIRNTANFKNITPQQLGNLALKFNMKLGGQNHQIASDRAADSSAFAPPSIFSSISQDAIVFGADVSHPSGGMSHTPSVAGVVASYDKNFALFSASMRLQAGTQETIEELEDMAYHRLKYFVDHRGFLPHRIVVYRDGVGEDQFAKCRSSEIPQVYRAYEKAKAYAKSKAKAVVRQSNDRDLDLTFIVVGKRHHTRFYACSEEDTYQAPNGQDTVVPQPFTKIHREGNVTHHNVKLNGNLQPGLLVDDVITRPSSDETFDFFLQSHDALKGTARSAHYSVLEKGTLDVQQIKNLTHAFCYNYMRATKGVSYAGPAYYADRLCDRGAHYLRGYTSRFEQPEIEMNDGEKKIKDKRKAARAFSKRVAEHISGLPDWNPDDDRIYREPNHGMSASTTLCSGYSPDSWPECMAVPRLLYHVYRTVRAWELQF
ncbi:hypothetical protein LTR37_005006 [Vermiconidia calcicola]|uniref:Uncharacterized protein n=1 Tax=Vermiconidia calcicola TaxID=1690605 RepID=A0ACC3NK49_9PEZI|nr:hypothetical protein LTR37_005006 [Vermiconidia calcicola]